MLNFVDLYFNAEDTIKFIYMYVNDEQWSFSSFFKIRSIPSPRGARQQSRRIVYSSLNTLLLSIWLYHKLRE